MSRAYARSKRMRPSSWAQEITAATQGMIHSRSGPRLMLPPYRLNPRAPLNQGLVAKYICLPGMTGGQYWYDLCGKNKGTLTNMTSGYGWQGAIGRPGGWGAMRFDGVNDYIAIANSSKLDFTSAYTISAWLYPPSLRNFETIAVRGNSIAISDIEVYIAGGTPGQALTIVHNRSNGGTLSFGHSSGGRPDGPTGNPPAATWTMLTITYDGSSAKIYYNGAYYTYKTLLPPLATGKGWYFGYLPAGGYSDESLDDISIYNLALSDAEVAGLYEASMNHYPTQLNRFSYRPRYVPSGFNPAWAARSTITIQPGICVGAA